MKALSWINFILGLWLIVAGFALSHGGGAIMAEEIVLGIIIALLAFGSVSSSNPAIAWCVVIAGLWTLLAPAAIDYSMHAASKANDIAVGVVVLVLGFANAVYRQSPIRTKA